METKMAFLNYGFVPFKPANNYKNVCFQVPSKPIPNSPFTEAIVNVKKNILSNDPSRMKQMFYIGSNMSYPSNQNALAFCRFIAYMDDHSIVENAKTKAE